MRLRRDPIVHSAPRSPAFGPAGFEPREHVDRVRPGLAELSISVDRPASVSFAGEQLLARAAMRLAQSIVIHASPIQQLLIRPKAGLKLELPQVSARRRQPMATAQLYDDDLAGIHIDGYDFHWRGAAPAVLQWLRRCRYGGGKCVFRLDPCTMARKRCRNEPLPCRVAN